MASFIFYSGGEEEIEEIRLEVGEAGVGRGSDQVGDDLALRYQHYARPATSPWTSRESKTSCLAIFALFVMDEKPFLQHLLIVIFYYQY